MENLNKPLLISPSGTPKTNPKKNFCPQSFPTIGTSTMAVHDCIPVISHVISQKNCTIYTKILQKLR